MSARFRPPPARRLRVYAFDPNASLDLASAKFSHATISLPWEEAARRGEEIDGKGAEERIFPGPINEYLEVIDVDPSSNQFYEPIDLNAPEVLAQDGLPPSEGDPRFHQQMVFAVVMNTIKLFERALGRRVIWRPQWNRERRTYDPTPRLRVYPHALREANAYYSPQKRALLFGYFNARQRSAGASWIFSALSHDIIVHETTHAILDGIHPRYSEPTSVDSLAFHEAFADIAALFSHFQLYEAVYDFIADSGGRLDQSGLLSGLAGQFAKGTTGRASLRDYIDKDPDPDLIATTTEAHERGAILVAAVFDAFLSIYTARTEDLLRMSGTRLGTSQHLHPDLVARLTKEATRSADHVLRMCIRALDYLPPVDVEFGEFLRAVITADNDLIPDDRLNYRLAFVEAFRRRGIFPDACLSMSPDNLLWDEPPELLATDDILRAGLNLMPIYKRHEIAPISERNRRKVWYWLSQPYMTVGDRGSRESETLDRLLTEARAILSADTATGLPYAERGDRGDDDDDPPASAGGADDRSAVADRLMEGIRRNLISLKVPHAEIRVLQEELRRAGSHIDQWDALLGFLQCDKVPGLSTDPTVDVAWEDTLG
ncbi:MAG: hypothetical protein KIS90_08235, partial [Phenylobacterium sp.]|nr:hypothetical protein [Phenylobacterium sp.]